MTLKSRPRLLACCLFLVLSCCFGSLLHVSGMVNSLSAVATASGSAVTPLPFRILDAEYSAALDRIITISEAPNRLAVFNPLDQTFASVALPRVPRAVSVSPDGLFAAVGHDALVSYVDLRQATLVKTLDVTADPADIVLAGNGKVYVSPVRDQWVQLHAIDIATNTEQVGGFYYAGLPIKLHANGQWLYGVDRNLSPTDLRKFDISVHPPQNIADSPYHGDYAMGGDLWMSQDGLRIFTACGNVFRASGAQGQDMIYNGNFGSQGIYSVGHLSHSQAANKIFVIPQRRDFFGGCYSMPTLPDTQVVILSYDHYSIERRVDLPQFQNGGMRYAAHGRFVFVNASGTQFYTIVQADSASALLYDFGVVVNSVDAAQEPSPTTSLTPKPTTQTPTSTPTSTPGSQTPGFAPVLKPLSYRVLDAEYSAALDRIITISEAPDRLEILNPVDLTFTSVALPRLPRAVSVSPDGLFAAVGHDALVSYVDLRQAMLVKTLDVTADPADIVLAGNGKVYVSPIRDQWGKLHAIDIATNTEQQSTGYSIYAGTIVKLHPNGQWLYGADRGLSPSDINKIDISTHPPALLYDSPYHGDYAMCGNLWLSEDGLRIFTACGNVFRVSAIQGHDMLYNGNLNSAGLSSIGHLSHSRAANKILAVPQSCAFVFACNGTATDGQVFIMTYDHFTLDRKMTLPRFDVGGRTFAAQGRFVFVNASGSEFYTIVQADPSAGLLNDYGVVRASMAALPLTPTPTPPLTATPTVAPSATPTVTPTPTSPSGTYFESNFTVGAPGSMFIFTAGNLPANAQVTIALRGPNDEDYQEIVTTRIGSGGQFVFVLVTAPQDVSGTYSVRLTIRSGRQNVMATTSIIEKTIELVGDAPTHVDRPTEPVLQVPARVPDRRFLPLVWR